MLVGENYLNRFGLDGRAYDVIAQSPRAQRLTAQALTQQYVRADDGSLVPLSGLVSLAQEVEPNQLTQFNQQNAATFQGVPAPGVTLGDAVAFLDGVAKNLPPGFSYDWQSDARQFATEGNALLLAFLAAVIVIYLVLAAQYESLMDPLIILITVPLSICGALIPLALGWATINIYTQIGLVTLIGLISKHGILMVEFANELQGHQGLDRASAIARAAPHFDDDGRHGGGPGAAAVRFRRGRQQPFWLGCGDRLGHAGRHPVYPVRAADHVHLFGPQSRRRRGQ